MKKTEGAEAIRLRWYGGMDNETIFVERKTHREDWTGEKSVKARFPIKEKYVNSFLAGRTTVDSIFEKMRKDGKKSEKEVAALERLAREVQYRVVTRKLVPVTRSFYNRTAFQLPGDARVRISLDTELTMVREDNLDGRDRAGKNWRRMDIGIDYPFSQVAPGDIERFPYAILEVKLQTQAGQEPPEWVRDLVSSHLVEAVPKFSKFIHGTATLFPTRIRLLPFWMPQMDIDIRKPISHRFGIERPGQSASYATSDEILDSEDEDSDDDEEEEEDDTEPENSPTLQGSTGPSSEMNVSRAQEVQDIINENDLSYTSAFGKHVPNELDIEERIADLPIQDPNDYPIYDSESEDESDAMEEAKRIGGWYYGHRVLRHHMLQAGERTLQALKLAAPTPRATQIPDTTTPMSALPQHVEAKRFRVPKGKRIHVPVRVEPKVFFAAERTFLSWLEFAILLGAVAGALLNFGDAVSLRAAFGFVVAACVALLYSLGLYVWRVEMIKKRRATRYHDRWGPSVLCGLLVLSVGVNFGLRLRKGNGA